VPLLALRAYDKLASYHPPTAAHSLRVATLYSQVDLFQRFDVELAALIHDTGKTSVPKRILDKRGPLTPREWARIQGHPRAALALLRRLADQMRRVSVPSTFSIVVAAHHERWDGRGYPDGLAGRDIPPEARLIAILDGYDAMREERPYKRARSHEDALEELLRCAGTQYDPQMTRHVVSVLRDLAPPHAVQTDPDAVDRRLLRALAQAS
jgi:HD-GYP domain-containing protein (c-di-GMP phosphodiesterase class II)